MKEDEEKEGTLDDNGNANVVLAEWDLISRLMGRAVSVLVAHGY